jgi:pSer/pThr/pTyr-binding forkhead associated (FHA) protein
MPTFGPIVIGKTLWEVVHVIGTLEFTSSGKAVLSVPLEEGRSLVIGRAPDADVPFVDLVTLSRRHCRVWAEAGRAWVEPLGCRGAILVNRKAILSSHELKEGDKVELLGDNLVFRLQPIPAS